MTTMLNLSPTATRASLIALAAVVTLSVLSALAQIANEQVQDVRLAQSPAVTQSAAADQVVVIVGKRIPRA